MVISLSLPDLNANLTQIPVTILDVETTGVSPRRGARVIEVALLQVQGNRVVAQLDTLIDPQAPLDPRAMAVNGITGGMLAHQPTFGAVLPQITAILASGLVVGHNINFDLTFLQAEYGLLGQSLPPLLALDTLPIARKYYRFPRNNLQTIAQALQIKADRFHRAMADVQVTAGVFDYFRADRGLETVQDWLSAQGKPVWRGVTPG
ncbi:3'-5' exonuclease [Prochlorothrix hollandica]|uniref:Exonuclease domain-containing protein n=1 Tax=Prochlorothrix hollandica PCC 9006 = CALU 1027 TaxID=317619 RepID=A0A0M2Q0N8_PROHO|nr:3'-5' exonuclease [Prochlorothrix hollandica]KKJ00207.1 hypothetical protein PROH_10920 [Prochlorothrix hollandica PCC 9006 = CALU 1027]